MTKAKKIKILVLVVWFLAILSFMVVLTVVQFEANGWKINWQTKQIIKTGMITLGGTPASADVEMNGRIIDTRLPTKISDLSPGYYDIVVKSPGYNLWQKSIQVLPQKASIYDNIVLFLEKPETTDVPLNITIESIKSEFGKKSTLLRVDEMEIYYNENLVTRFSQNVLLATLYSDQRHIIFQVGNEIRVIDIDGTNNVLLVTLEKAEPTELILRENGKVLYYIDKGQVFGLTIR